MSNMITHTANGKGYLIVQIEMGASDFEIVPNTKDTSAVKFSGRGIIFKAIKYIELPPGNYAIQFIAEQATEEQAREVGEVGATDESGIADWFDYEELLFTEISSLYSLHSLIRANFPDHAEFNHIVLLKN